METPAAAGSASAIEERAQGVPDVLLDPPVAAGLVPPEVVPDEAATAGAVTVMSRVVLEV